MNPFLVLLPLALTLGLTVFCVRLVRRERRKYREEHRNAPVPWNEGVKSLSGAATAIAALLSAVATLITATAPIWAEKDSFAPDGEPRPEVAQSPPGEGSVALPEDEESETPRPEPQQVAYVEDYSDQPFVLNPPSVCKSTYVSFESERAPKSGVTDRIGGLPSSERESVNLTYSLCGGRAQLAVYGDSYVGILREGEPDGAEECSVAARGSSIGQLGLRKRDEPELAGLVPGAHLCALTPSGRVSRATLVEMAYPGGQTAPVLTFRLTTWVPG